MSDPSRPTKPPAMEPRGSIARPRAKLPSFSDGGGDHETRERELLLQAIQASKAEIFAVLEQRLQQSTAPPSAKKKHVDWNDLATKIVAAVAAIAALVANLKPAKDERVDPAYEAVSKAVTTLDNHQRASDANAEQRWAWLLGYLQATGVKVPVNNSAPPPAIVELQPAPLARGEDVIRGTDAPAVQVKTRPPAPLPSTKPIELPRTLDK